MLLCLGREIKKRYDVVDGCSLLLLEIASATKSCCSEQSCLQYPSYHECTHWKQSISLVIYLIVSTFFVFIARQTDSHRSFSFQQGKIRVGSLPQRTPNRWWYHRPKCS